MMYRHNWRFFCCSTLMGGFLSQYQIKGDKQQMPKTSYPNQDMVTIHKEPFVGNFLQVNKKDWMEAFTRLAPNTFALYLYLCGNQNNFRMGLSPTAIKNELGFSASSYHRGKNDLKREGYLIVSERSDHVLDFYTTPQCTQSKMTAAATPDTSAPAASAPSMQIEPSNDFFSFDSSYGWED